MKVSEVLREGLEVLGENGEYWLQGDLHSEDGIKHCAVGAITYLGYNAVLRQNAFQCLSDAASLLGFENKRGKYHPNISILNDMMGWETVKLMYKHAIAMAEEQEELVDIVSGANNRKEGIDG